MACHPCHFCPALHILRIQRKAQAPPHSRLMLSPACRYGVYVLIVEILGAVSTLLYGINLMWHPINPPPEADPNNSELPMVRACLCDCHAPAACACAATGRLHATLPCMLWRLGQAVILLSVLLCSQEAGTARSVFALNSDHAEG